MGFYDAEILNNEYHADDGDGYIYVSGCLEKDGDGIWRASTFGNHELEQDIGSPSLGFIISSNLGFRDTVDHAPDVALVMAALGMIPDNLERVLCIDRRGRDDAVPCHIKRFVEKGSCVVYDGNYEAPFRPAYPKETFSVHTRWSPEYSSKVVFDGSFDLLGERAWKDCHETAAAQKCWHVKQLLEQGETIHRSVEQIPDDWHELKDTVKVMSCKRIDAPDHVVNWPALGVLALSHRKEEAETHFGDLGDGDRIEAVARCWDSVMSRRRHRPCKARNVARKWGIDTMLDAFDSGVPIDYIIA